MNEIPLNILKYRIIGASTEDIEHPLYSIFSPTPTQGWNSVRFCSYPQELLFQFPYPVRLRQLDIVLHETKIPSKIDIYVFMPKTYEEFSLNYNQIVYNKVGFVIPDTNAKTEYKARELKKVYVNENAYYLKFVFGKCFNNIYNIFNQVGLISLSCYGFEFNPQNINDLYPNRNKDLNNLLVNTDNYIPFPDIDIAELDESYRNKINEIQQLLDKSVQEEDYDNAKTYHELINRIKMLGIKYKNLQELKMKSIETAQYEMAKKAKEEIERMKTVIDGIVVEDYIKNNSLEINMMENNNMQNINEGNNEKNFSMMNNNTVNYNNNLNSNVNVNVNPNSSSEMNYNINEMSKNVINTNPNNSVNTNNKLNSKVLSSVMENENKKEGEIDVKNDINSNIEQGEVVLTKNSKVSNKEKSVKSSKESNNKEKVNTSEKDKKSVGSSNNHSSENKDKVNSSEKDKGKTSSVVESSKNKSSSITGNKGKSVVSSSQENKGVSNSSSSQENKGNSSSKKDGQSGGQVSSSSSKSNKSKK